ncbi:MAG: hypothetical protein Q6363_008030 [Candidatus Njordarchaeota archaeon]
MDVRQIVNDFHILLARYARSIPEIDAAFTYVEYKNKFLDAAERYGFPRDDALFMTFRQFENLFVSGIGPVVGRIYKEDKLIYVIIGLPPSCEIEYLMHELFHVVVDNIVFKNFGDVRVAIWLEGKIFEELNKRLFVEKVILPVDLVTANGIMDALLGYVSFFARKKDPIIRKWHPHLLETIGLPTDISVDMLTVALPSLCLPTVGFLEKTRIMLLAITTLFVGYAGCLILTAQKEKCANREALDRFKSVFAAYPGGTKVVKNIFLVHKKIAKIAEQAVNENKKISLEDFDAEVVGPMRDEILKFFCYLLFAKKIKVVREPPVPIHPEFNIYEEKVILKSE